MKRSRHIETLEPRTLLAADLIISEVMSSNDAVLRDEDGSSPDWIELYNTGTADAELGGLHLTDNVDNRTKWQFPDGTLKPGESMIVFASGKDRAVQGNPLHTNFKLSSAGEYIGLYDTDGRTKIFDFETLPTQFTDISYGVSQNLTARTLLTTGDTAKVLLPNSAASDLSASEWTAASFDDASWLDTKTGIGFDNDASDGDFGPLIHADGSLAAMNGLTGSAYVRQAFELPAADVFPTYEDITLDLNYDDGFVAYLNGEEVLKVNAPDDLAWDSVATDTHGGIGDALSYPDFAGVEGDFTVKGDAAWGGDVIQLTPSAADQNGAVWRTTPVKFGADYTFEASMVYDVHTPGGPFVDGDGAGAEGMTFVIQATDNNVLGRGGPSLGLEGAGMTFLAIELDSNANGAFDEGEDLASHIGVNTSANGSVARAAIPRFNGDAFFPGQPGPGSNFSYIWVKYTGETTMLDVYYSKTDQKPAEPTISVAVDMDELFSGTPELFTGWTATTSGSFNGHDVRSFDIITGVGELGREVESFNLAEHVDKLQPGTNVLAIHGLNVSADDEDFLLSAQLSVDEVVLGDSNYFAEPTPGALNGQATLAPGGTVTISEGTKLFTEPFTVSITAESNDAVIRYTTDGTLPNEESDIYTTPLTITEQTRLRARAFQPDKSPGPVSTAGYTKVADELVNFEDTGKPFESNLPVIVIDAFGGRRINSDSRNMTIGTGTFIAPDADGTAGLFDAPELVTKTGMRVRGQTSEGFAKKQYALEFVEDGVDDTDRYVASELEDVAHSVFGLPAESDWVLNGPYSDKTQLNNYLTFNLFRDIGQYAPRTRLVELFVNTTDELNMRDSYRGTYVLLEKIKVDSERIDITPLDPGDKSPGAITGGYAWKKDKTGAEDLNITTGNQRQEVRIIEPSCSDAGRDSETRMNICVSGEIAPEQITWLNDHLTEFEDVLYGRDFADPTNGYAKYIDVDSWVDTWLMVEFTKNIDGFRLSTYYYKDRGGKIQQGPAWDYNLSFGNGNYLKGAYPEGWYHEGISAAQYPYWDRLFEDPAFQQRVSERWAELRQDELSTEAVLGHIQTAVDALSNGNPNLDRPAEGEPSNPISRNFDRWTRGGYSTSTYEWPNCFIRPGDDCPESPLPGGRSQETYGDYIDIMEWFVTNRAAWMDSQLVPPLNATPSPGVVRPSTEVSIVGPEGFDLYYTTNGADPEEPLFIKENHEILGENATGRITVPTNNQMIEPCTGFSPDEPLKCFVNPDYELGSTGETWTDVTLGVGFDDGAEFDGLITTDIGGVMKGNASAYMAVDLNLPGDLADKATALSMDARFNGGFAMYAWLPSREAPVEIMRANINGTSRRFPIRDLDYNETAVTVRTDADAMAFETFDVGSLLQYLTPGDNQIFFQLSNDAVDSDDFLFDFRLNLETTRTEVSPNVIRYEGPITIDDNTSLFVKGFNPDSEEWTTGLVADYIVDLPEVAITELHYNPADPTMSENLKLPGVLSEDFEFIEVLNTSSETASLVGLHFTNGVDFTFDDVDLDAGERGVVVSNSAAFVERYGNDIKILGEYNGALSNGGERITLADPSGNPMVDFSYSDSALWPSAADGIGASLVMTDPINTPGSLQSKGYNWRSSQEYGGSPGSAGIESPGIVINEILSRTDGTPNSLDVIELLNTTNSPVDIGGWYLSDSSDNFLKYQVPSGTSVPAGATYTVDATAFNSDPEADNSFGLSGTDGDDLYVTTAVDGVVQTIVDDVHFGGSLEGESWSRYPHGRGRLAPTPSTLGEANAYPRVGPVIISEVNYNPGEPSAAALAIDPTIDSGDLEFVEIHNPTPSIVSTTDWRLRGGARFNFELNSSLEPNSTSLLISFDPANATRLSAFKAHYGLGEDVTIIGNYSGQLSGDEDRVTLLSRDLSLIDQPVVLPQIMEDEVIYDSAGLWPSEADGQGMSLQRIAADQYGNMSTSWMAAAATPGSATFSTGMPGDFDGDGMIGVADINQLCTEVHSASPDIAFDLNGDGTVDLADHTMLIRDILRTTPGDSNLDGAFDSRDLIQVFQGGEYHDGIDGNGDWANGDWNCDGEFTSRDFVAAFRVGEYVREAAPADSVAGRSAASGDIAAAVHLDQSAEVTLDVAEPEHAVEETDRTTAVAIELTSRQSNFAATDRVFAEAADEADIDDDEDSDFFRAIVI